MHSNVAISLILSTLLSLAPARLPAAFVMENLDRGVVAARSGTANFVSWRFLGTDPADIGFNIYRGALKLNALPITDRSNYSDAGAPAGAQYSVRPVIGGVEQSPSPTVTAWASQALTVNLQQPAGGTNLDGIAYTYSPGDMSVGDLDGDGSYELVLKWDPSDAKDNSQDGYTGNVFLDAYRLNGTRLWRIDLGRNIRAGAHYTQFMVYDFDSDGRAEVMVKTAPNTRDGLDAFISRGPAASANHAADYRNGVGRSLSGPEYLTVFNGLSGAEMATVSYVPRRHPGTDDPSGAQMCEYWGDNWGNRMDRFLAGVAYLDGQQPSAVMARGYYPNQSSCGGTGRSVVWAVDWRGGVLSTRWIFDTRDPGNAQYINKGAHSLSIADLDGDGRHEIVYGAAAIDDNGAGLHNTTWNHGDALHAADIDPSRPGIEIFMPNETASANAANLRPGISMRNGATGALIWGKYPAADSDIGRGVCANISAARPGMECWGSGGIGFWDAQGNAMPGAIPTGIGGAQMINFLLWWDGNLERNLLDREAIVRWADTGSTRLLNAYDVAAGAASINGTKATPNLSGDILGDWREEVIFRNSNNTQLHIFTTVNASAHKVRTLMHDPQYRVAIAWQNTAYNQPPHPSFFLGTGYALPPAPDITLAGAAPQPTATRSPTPAAASPTRTPTRTATRSPSPSATRTATASVTVSATPSATRTTTRTATPSASQSPSSTRTATPSATPSASPTRTSSASSTPSPTGTLGASAPTATPTATASASPTATPSVTPSVTHSATPSGSPTRTTTATVTATPTVSVTFLETDTHSPTRSGTPSATPSMTFSESPSATPAATPTRTASPTPSSTSTASPTSTVVVFSPTFTPAATGTGTPSVTPSATRTATSSATRSPSTSPTPSPTSTHSTSPTPSPTGTHSTSPTPSPTGTLRVNSPTVSPSPTASPTASPVSGPLVIERVVAWPNPNPRVISVKLAGPAERLTLKIYTPAWVLISSSQAGPAAPGWSQLPLPADMSQAPRGLYYFVVQAQAGTRLSQPQRGRFFLF